MHWFELMQTNGSNKITFVMEYEPVETSNATDSS